jgi:hypothetical protein
MPVLPEIIGAIAVHDAIQQVCQHLYSISTVSMGPHGKMQALKVSSESVRDAEYIFTSSCLRYLEKFHYTHPITKIIVNSIIAQTERLKDAGWTYMYLFSRWDYIKFYIRFIN